MPIELEAHTAVIAGAYTFGATALIWINILRLRSYQAKEAKIVKEVTARWHPVLSLASFGILPELLPPLSKKEHAAFLKLWVYLLTSLRGEARTALSDIAMTLGCDKLVLRMLVRAHRGDKLLATVVAGHLRLVPALHLLLVSVKSADSILSLQALQAILRIAPDMAPTLVPLCVKRDDWPIALLLTSLRDCSGILLAPMVAAIESDSEFHAQRAIQLIAGLRIAPDITFQKRLIAQESALLLAESFILIDQQLLLPLVRSCLQHEDDRVRSGAVCALARMGQAEDLPALERLLGDRSWIVRNQAARGIAALPGGGKEALRLAGESCNNREGLNMARHVLAEIRLAS